MYILLFLDIEDNKKRPAEIMELMRMKGYKDLELTFVGMAFIILGALKVIQSAVATVVKIEKPPRLWILMVLSFIIIAISFRFESSQVP